MARTAGTLKRLTALMLIAFCWWMSASVMYQEPPKTFDIKVTIKNIRNKSGRIQLHLYKDQQSYSERKGWKSKHLYKNEMQNSTLTYTFKGIPPGVYGLALLDDENKNGVIDYGWLLPKEGFGFGDYYHTKWSTPHFDDFKFYLKSNKSVTMVVRYL